MKQEDLAASIARSRNFAIGLVVVVIAAYLVHFIFIVKTVASTDPAAWGQFGDYVGGLLNPLIAFLAFYWLTQSILLQKEELAATQKALRDSAEAQLKQERHAFKTAQINALNALLSSYNNDISTLRNNLEFVSSQLREPRAVISPQGQELNHQGARQLLGEIQGGLQSALIQRLALTDEITKLLRGPNV